MMSDFDFIEYNGVPTFLPPYNRRIVEEFRANGGQVQGWAPLILLTTKESSRNNIDRVREDMVAYET